MLDQELYKVSLVVMLLILIGGCLKLLLLAEQIVPGPGQYLLRI